MDYGTNEWIGLELSKRNVDFHKEKNLETHFKFQGFKFGGDNRDRTDDLLNAIQALSQLSYIPK